MSYLYGFGGPGVAGIVEDLMKLGGKAAGEAGGKADTYASDLYNQATGKSSSSGGPSIKGFSVPTSKPWIGGSSVVLLGTWPSDWRLMIMAGGSASQISTRSVAGGVEFTVPNYSGVFDVVLVDGSGTSKWAQSVAIEPAKGTSAVPIPHGNASSGMSSGMIVGGLLALGVAGYVLSKRR